MITTTRRVEELQSECAKAGVSYDPDWGRERLMDALRAKLGMFDVETELDPMKAKDLKHEIRWEQTDSALRYAGIARYLTPSWRAEPKLDGCRLRMVLGLTSNSLVTGRRSVRTYAYTQRSDNFPHLRDAVIPELVGVIFDGEILAPVGKLQTHTGTWTNSLLNASVALCNSNPQGSQATQRRFGRAQFHVFDVLTGNNDGQIVDLSSQPYSARRLYLTQLVELLVTRYPDCGIRLVPSLPATVGTIEQSLLDGHEGVMLKHVDGGYEAGKRSPRWLKVKTFSTADAFVVGYAAGENGNEGLVGSLDVAVYQPGAPGEPDTVRPVAQLGNLTLEMRKAISAPDGSLKDDFYRTVLEFMAQGIGKNGRARHAHLVRLRPDKSPEDCRVDQLDVFPRV